MAVRQLRIQPELRHRRLPGGPRRRARDRGERPLPRRANGRSASESASLELARALERARRPGRPGRRRQRLRPAGPVRRRPGRRRSELTRSCAVALAGYLGKAERPPGRSCFPGNRDRAILFDPAANAAVAAAGFEVALEAELQVDDRRRVRSGSASNPDGATTSAMRSSIRPIHATRRSATTPSQRSCPRSPASTSPWLAGIDRLADPSGLPRFVASRLTYRRIVRWLWWLLLPDRGRALRQAPGLLALRRAEAARAVLVPIARRRDHPRGRSHRRRDRARRRQPPGLALGRAAPCSARRRTGPTTAPARRHARSWPTAAPASSQATPSSPSSPRRYRLLCQHGRLRRGRRGAAVPSRPAPGLRPSPAGVLGGDRGRGRGARTAPARPYLPAPGDPAGALRGGTAAATPACEPEVVALVPGRPRVAAGRRPGPQPATGTPARRGRHRRPGPRRPRLGRRAPAGAWPPPSAARLHPARGERGRRRPRRPCGRRPARARPRRAARPALAWLVSMLLLAGTVALHLDPARRGRAVDRRPRARGDAVAGRGRRSGPASTCPSLRTGLTTLLGGVLGGHLHRRDGHLERVARPIATVSPISWTEAWWATAGRLVGIRTVASEPSSGCLLVPGPARHRPRAGVGRARARLPARRRPPSLRAAAPIPPSERPTSSAGAARARSTTSPSGATSSASSSATALVAYAIYGGICLVSPDPICAPEERDELWSAFRRFADEHGWSVAVLGAGEEWLPRLPALRHARALHRRRGRRRRADVLAGRRDAQGPAPGRQPHRQVRLHDLVPRPGPDGPGARGGGAVPSWSRGAGARSSAASR